MKAHEIWNLDLLKEEVAKVWHRLRSSRIGFSAGTEPPQAFTLDILARAGTQQRFEIAEALGVDLNEYFMSEAEWDAFQERFRHLRKEIPAELEKSLNLAEGFLLSLDYDEEGNFGLILRERSPDEKESPTN